MLSGREAPVGLYELRSGQRLATGEHEVDRSHELTYPLSRRQREALLDLRPIHAAVFIGCLNWRHVTSLPMLLARVPRRVDVRIWQLMTTHADREALKQHVLTHSVKWGEFTLKSGATSTWFLDTKQTMCRPEGALLVAAAALEVIPPDIDAIGGLTMGADPVGYGIAAIGATTGRNLRSFSIRKEAKDHGVTGRIAGALLPGDRVVITEDTVTRGTSPMEAAAVVREFGAIPVMIMVIVDRGGTCRAMAEADGIIFHPLLTAEDLGFAYGS